MATTSNRQRAGIVRRGSKWAFVIRIPDATTGKTKQVWSSGFTSEKEAKLARDKARASVGNGTFITPSKTTVEEFLNRWIDIHSLTLKPTTEAEYRARVRLYLIPHLGKIPLEKLRPIDIQGMYVALIQGGGKDGRALSAKSVSNIGAVLKKSLQYAFDVENLVSRNVASRVPSPKGESARNSTWSSRELNLFLEGMSEHRLCAFFRLAAFTGARRSEILGLKWEDFDSENKRISIERVRVKSRTGVAELKSTKGGDGRRLISLDDKTVEIVKTHRKRQREERLLLGSSWSDTGYMFVQADGLPIDPDTPSQLFTKSRKRLGLSEQRLHDLRHVHATELLRAGVPLHVVADRLGHRDAMVTATIYAHVRADQAESVADIFAKAVE